MTSLQNPRATLKTESWTRKKNSRIWQSNSKAIQNDDKVQKKKIEKNKLRKPMKQK